MFCEEYQVTLFKEHHMVFDKYRNKTILYGELIWNFQDFMTDFGKFNYMYPDKHDFIEKLRFK